MEPIRFFQWKIILPLVLLFVLCLIPSLPFAESLRSSITLDNQSGQDTLVKVMGPTSHLVEVPNKEKRTVKVSKGKYYLLAKYERKPGEYFYSRGEPFKVKETPTKFSKIRITLHPVVNGNYSTKPISAAEFENTIPASELKVIEPIPLLEPLPEIKLVEPVPANYTKLVHAIFDGDIKKAQTLLDNGADVNFDFDDDYTPLLIASQEGHKAIVAKLLDNNAKVDHQNKIGATALIIASDNGHHEVVKALLAKGAYVNHQNKAGGTALMAASFSGHEKVLKVLLKKGSNVDLQTNGGQTALSLAKTKRIAELLKVAGAK